MEELILDDVVAVLEESGNFFKLFGSSRGVLSKLE